MSMWMWHPFYLLFFVILILPLAAKCNVVCTGDGNHTARSNYEANIRVFTAILPNRTSSTPSRSANYDTGDGMYAVSYCHNSTDSSSCRACITFALQEAQTVCPYQKGVEFSNGNCSLKLSKIIYLGTPDFLVLKHDGYKYALSMMINLFVAIGFVWLYFLIRQYWDDRNDAL
uniref:Uncharacterized protein n=1 Tax=Avena sativa TaxID=4498 RepID=A0ACD5ULS7_AVESA